MNYLRNVVLLNGFKMSPVDMRRYGTLINSYRPYFIRGYAGALFELVKFFAAHNIKVYSPKFIVSAAETLHPAMKEKIEQVFAAPIVNFYGTREVGDIAGECFHGSMHLLPFYNMVEILDNNNQPAREGRVVITNLHNFTMPFIRYDIGDLAIRNSEGCSCGDPTPTLKKITGRVTDNFYLKNGTVIPAEFFIHMIGVVFNEGEIKQFQVIQERYERLRIVAVFRRRLAQTKRNDVEQKLRLVMSKNCQIIWENVNEIPKTSSGKYLYTKSLVKNPVGK